MESVETLLRRLIRDELTQVLQEHLQPQAEPKNSLPKLPTQGNGKNFTVDEAAEYANRHPGSIRRALLSGELHGMQTMKGGRWQVEKKCIDAYLSGGLCKHRQNVVEMPKRKTKKD